MGISVTIRGESNIRKRLDTMRQQFDRSRGVQILEAGVWNEGQVTKSGTPVPEYAYYNNYGTPHIPSRPFMTSAWLEEKDRLTAYLREALVLYGSLYNAFMVVGEHLVAQIVRQIWSNIQPENTKTTLKHKTPGMPTLVDTQTMVKSVKYKINGSEPSVPGGAAVTGGGTALPGGNAS